MVASSLARSLVLGETFGLDNTIYIVPPLRPPVRRPTFRMGGRALRLARGSLSAVCAVLQLIQQIAKPVGHPLAKHIIVNPLEDISEPPLIFAAQPSSGLSYLGMSLHNCLWPWPLSC
jgi:hypothetical protein